MIREKIIIKYIKGKDILDIGSVGQTSAYNLWDILEKHAGKLAGIDTEPCNKQNVIYGNMENYDFNKRFDVIVAGDVIEHVNNQGLFLQNIKRHLKRGGYFILTTPNAKWFNIILKPNKTHTCWHDRYTLSYLLKKFGFKTVFFKYYYGNKEYYNFIKRILALRQSMIFICQHEKISSNN